MNEREKYDGTLAIASKKERTNRDSSHHAVSCTYIYIRGQYALNTYEDDKSSRARYRTKQLAVCHRWQHY